MTIALKVGIFTRMKVVKRADGSLKTEFIHLTIKMQKVKEIEA